MVGRGLSTLPGARTANTYHQFAGPSTAKALRARLLNGSLLHGTAQTVPKWWLESLASQPGGPKGPADPLASLLWATLANFFINVLEPSDMANIANDTTVVPDRS